MGWKGSIKRRGWQTWCKSVNIISHQTFGWILDRTWLKVRARCGYGKLIEMPRMMMYASTAGKEWPWHAMRNPFTIHPSIHPSIRSVPFRSIPFHVISFYLILFHFISFHSSYVSSSFSSSWSLSILSSHWFHLLMPWPSRQWQVADAEWKELTAITSSQQVVLPFTILPSVIQPHKSCISHCFSLKSRPKGETKYSSEMSKSRKQEHDKQGSEQAAFCLRIQSPYKKGCCFKQQAISNFTTSPKKEEQPWGSVILFCRSGFGWAARVPQWRAVSNQRPERSPFFSAQSAGWRCPPLVQVPPFFLKPLQKIKLGTCAFGAFI